MTRPIRAAALALLAGAATLGHAQPPQGPPGNTDPPAPGTRGNPDNVPLIGRRDPKGNPVRLARATGHVSNYSEDKVRPFTLPDPLVTAGGRRVTTALEWFKVRRPEILAFYQDEIYGRIPPGAPKVSWVVVESDAAARGGTAIMRRVTGRMGEGHVPDGPRMNLTVHMPAGARGPVPVLLSLTFGFGPGARAQAAGKTTPRPSAGPEKGEPSKQSDVNMKGRGPGAFDAVGEVLGRGWGYASLNYTEIQPDRADRWTEGVIGFTLKKGQARPAPNEWGTISAWAWGISRAIDYLETDPTVDARRIAITGASRLGKTVLWAAALDQRVAAVFSVVSGEMGAALIRRDWGETLDDMAQNFPWQFAGNFQKWVGRWDELPVDQHMLISLCAPRPVYVNGGLTDQWSDPKGEFLALAAAGPVYRLLGGKGLGVGELPPLDAPVTGGDLAFHYHSGGHMAVRADWKAFLDFADRHFRGGEPRSSPSRTKWLQATAFAIPKHTAPEGEGYFSIVEGHNRRLYVGTHANGVNSWLVEFDPAGAAMKVVVDAHRAIGTDRKGFGSQAKIHTRNNVGKSGRIYFGTKQGYPAAGEKREDYPGGYPMVYDPETGRIRVYGIPVPHEGISSITPDEEMGVAYISTCSDHRPGPEENAHFLVLDLARGTYKDLIDTHHIYAFIVVDYRHRALHPMQGGDVLRYDPTSDHLERLKQTIGGAAPRPESHLADPEGHPINWDIAPDGKTLYSLPMSTNQLFAYDLTQQGDTLAGRSLGTLVPGARGTDCRAMCVGPEGTVWAAVTESQPQVGHLLHLVSYRPGEEAPRDHGPVAIRNPDYTSFIDAAGKPLPAHGGLIRLADGTTTTRHVILGVCQARDRRVYVLALQPYTLLQIEEGAL
jgi:hypothetical protein